jgi:hypothetical protein
MNEGHDVHGTVGSSLEEGMRRRLSFLVGVGVCSLFLASAASAATITFDPPAVTATVHTFGNVTMLAPGSTAGFVAGADVFAGSDEAWFDGFRAAPLIISFLNPVYNLSAFVGVEETVDVTNAFRVRLYSPSLSLVHDNWYDTVVINEYSEGSFGPVVGPVKFALLNFSLGDGTTFTDEYALDNLTYEEAAPVPEPATLALFGLGAAGVRALRRRKAA